MKNFHRNSIKLNHREPQRLNNRILYTSVDEQIFIPKEDKIIKVLKNGGNTKLWCISTWCF
jgi:hypothetical protein